MRRTTMWQAAAPMVPDPAVRQPSRVGGRGAWTRWRPRPPVPAGDRWPAADRAVRRAMAGAWTGLAARAGALAARPQAGMATAEYAIATLAAAAFAGLLLVILRSAEVRGMLLGIIRQALQVG
ncbi:DUF4244 domain-containing protein [Georgenia faecalis]|uniref:DUF4244 domain-containing protein n=1 Tax=Georgenia faecalis TaxID=2483799 RepID=UPI000FDAB452|nr:DUF4244 domain-containing protein [Georgenia faecalis]